MGIAQSQKQQGLWDFLLHDCSEWFGSCLPSVGTKDFFPNSWNMQIRLLSQMLKAVCIHGQIAFPVFSSCHVQVFDFKGSFGKALWGLKETNFIKKNTWFSIVVF